MNVFDIDFRPYAAGPRLHETDRQNAGGGAALFRPSPPRSRRSLRSGSHRPATTGRGRPATTTKATRPWERILAARWVDSVTVRWVNDFATSGSKPSVVGMQICEPRANRAARRDIAGRRTGKPRVSTVFSTPTENFVGDRKSAHPSFGWGDSLQPHARGLVRSAPATRVLLGQIAAANAADHPARPPFRSRTDAGTARMAATLELP